MQQISKYKKTELGEIPEDWNVLGINELGEIITGNTPSTSVDEYYGNDYLWASPVDLGDIKYIERTQKMLSDKGFQVTRKIPTKSVLVVCIGSTIGKIGIATREMATNQQINSVICNPEVDNEFIYYQLIQNYKKIRDSSNQLAVPIINKNGFGLLKIILPKQRREQQKIASILSHVDELIQKIDQIVEQTQRIKKGLMQTLLTKGILHTKFKRTFLGEIPEEWNIKQLSDIGRIVGGGTPATSKKVFWENGNIAWAVPTDLTALKTNYIDRTERYITKKGLENSAAKLLPVGTILITSRATIGECALNMIPMTTNQGFQSLICNSENNNLFFLYLIKFNKNRLIRKSHGTTFLEISKTNINSLKLAIPPLKEQQKVASILSNVDEFIQKQQMNKSKFENLKKGLMQQLLTGKIRVKV